MIGASSSLSGDTLIACHFPVVRLPTWQLPVRDLCSSAKKPGRLCSVGLTRAASLPEQNTLTREHAFTGGRRHFSNSYGSLIEDRAEEEGTSDSSGKYDSTSSPEETSSHQKKENTLRSHNSFLPNTELDGDEEDEDSDGDNLHRYHEDSSFVLHGNSNWTLSSDVNYTLLDGEVDSEWGSEGMMLGTGRDQDNQMGSLQPDCQFQFHVSRPGIRLELDSDRQDNTSCYIYGQHKCSPELLSNTHAESGSDSSSNSSDGVLVNFCTIYNKSNNPATPHDLSSPAVHPSQSSEGSVFLHLHPVPTSPTHYVLNDDIKVYSPSKGADTSLCASHKSPQGLDSNCNLYSLEPLPPGLSSLEVSDLAACLQSQASLVIETNQKYYKLVTCDLSSQSPSPAWSSLTSCPEGPGRSNPFPPLIDSKKEEQDSDVLKACDHQIATTSTDKAHSRKLHADSIQVLSHSPCSLRPDECDPQSRKHQDAGVGSAQPFVIQELDGGDATGKGVFSTDKEVVCCRKLQRPTSLPIQPFVLPPMGKPQSQVQNLGGLLEQYMNLKINKPGTSQNGIKFKEKRNRCLSELQSSPLGSNRPIFLEAPSSPDTCSTCTPSPQCPSQFSKNQHSMDPHNTSLKPMLQVKDNTSPSCNKTNSFTHLISTHSQSKLVKIPTYQNLINLPSEPRSPNNSLINAADQSISSQTSPTLPLTTESYHLNLRASQSPDVTSQQVTLQQHPPSPPSDSGFFHSSMKAAVAPLSSLSSFFSSTTSGLQIQDTAGLISNPNQSQTSQSLILSDRLPTEFSLSPDTSYDSISISHLQRKGLLRSVSIAVDLIMTHFGCSRDPDEKMRLGNSSYSPTIAGLVLEHLCPAINNILEDGLRDHKLDFIIGQRPNHSWNVVEISTRIGPSTRVLQSLVSKIRQCPELSSHSMRLRAFIMGLLNLRSLEFWISHLQSQKDVVMTFYHSWGFLFMSLTGCQPLFQELLLLLQPLSMLPFDLNLLLEPRLVCHKQLRSEEQEAFPPQPCSALLVTSWPKLQADRKVDVKSNSLNKSQQTNRSQSLAPVPEFLPNKPDLVAGRAKEADFSRNHTWFQISVDERRVEKQCITQNMVTPVQVESPCESSLRWAKLFGAAGSSTRAERSSQNHTGSQTRRHKLPSDWLNLDRTQLGLLAQSIRSFKLGGTQTHTDC